MYSYSLFGLTVQSSFLLPELPVSNPSENAHPDVVIHNGDVPDTLSEVKTQGVAYEINENQFRIEIQGIGRYLVSNGSEIVVAPEAGTDDASVRLFLLSSGLGALLHQRGMLAIHSSCIETPKGAVLFAGISGAGKSTTAAAFHKRGYAVLADDITVVKAIDDGSLVALPGYPQMKLWTQALDKLEHDFQGLERVRPSLEKYYVPLREGFYSKPLRLHRVYVLTSNNLGELSIDPITGMRKLKLLRNHIYRLMLLTGMGKINESLMTMAQNVRVCLVKRPEDGYRLDDLIDLLEEDFTA